MKIIAIAENLNDHDLEMPVDSCDNLVLECFDLIEKGTRYVFFSDEELAKEFAFEMRTIAARRNDESYPFYVDLDTFITGKIKPELLHTCHTFLRNEW